MATTTMASLGFYDILVREGMHPPITMRVNGADIFPGMPVTTQGETNTYDVCLPDAAGDSVVGVTGLLENQAIGVVYANNAEIPVYLTGSGAIVRMYHGKAVCGDITFGEILVAQSVEAVGHVESLRRALEGYTDAGVCTVLATAIVHIFSIVGRAQETHASCADTEPIRVLLSI